VNWSIKYQVLHDSTAFVGVIKQKEKSFFSSKTKEVVIAVG
jgi:hypothetical protein